MRTAFVTPLYRSSNASPTILELLVYWLASAMGIHAAFVPVQARSYHPKYIALLDMLTDHTDHGTRADEWIGMRV